MLYTALRCIIGTFVILCALVYAPSTSSLLFLLSAILILPIQKSQNYLHKALPPSWIRLMLCGFLFAIAIVGAPSLHIDTYNQKDTTQAYSTTKLKDRTSEKAALRANKETTEETEDSVSYSNGQYKVGNDMPAGVYYLFATENRNWSSAYYCISADANDKNIIHNNLFEENYMVEVFDGEFLTLERCYAIPYEEGIQLSNDNDYLADGFYIVGEHIQPGEYKLIPDDDGNAYYCIYSDLRGDIYKNGLPSGQQYIEVHEGQYLYLKKCKIYIGE